MKKDNILFGVIGLLLGLIIGFWVTNSLNRDAAKQVSRVNPANPQAAGLPPDHPEVAGQVNPATMTEVQAAVDRAKKETDNFEAQTAAADLYYRIQRYGEAIGFLARANKIKPDDYEIIVKLGNANFDGEKFAEAESWYLKALKMKPDDVNVRTDLGLTFIFRSPPDYDRAIKEFLGSLERDPQHPQTLQNLVVAYTKKGDLKNARATLGKLEAVDPQNAAIPRLKQELANPGA